MAGSKVLQFFLLISFVIFSTHALHVLLTDGKGKNGFNYETGIVSRVDENGIKHYNGGFYNKTYKPGTLTIKVIVYMKNYQTMTTRTLRRKYAAKRVEISKTLREHNYEILYLGVNGFIRSEQNLIAEFILESINLIYFQINTIGEKNLNLSYKTAVHDLDKYQEEPNVFEGDLLGKLRSLDIREN